LEREVATLSEMSADLLGGSRPHRGAGPIICLECGQSLKMLKRHLAADHGMTPEEYRAKWDLPFSYPMVAPEYAATRSQLAKESGLGRKVEATPPPKKPGRQKRR
jgi:predicted transcriptional regulator